MKKKIARLGFTAFSSYSPSQELASTYKQSSKQGLRDCLYNMLCLCMPSDERKKNSVIERLVSPCYRTRANSLLNPYYLCIINSFVVQVHSGRVMTEAIIDMQDIEQ